MDIPTQPDLTRFTEFNVLTLSTHPGNLIQPIKDGWRLIATWVERPAANADGAFDDELKGLFGR